MEFSLVGTFFGQNKFTPWNENIYNTGHQKLGHSFRKEFRKLKLSKNVKNKKYSPFQLKIMLRRI